MLRRLFSEHPAAVGESYGEHCIVALGFAGRMFLAAGACFVHAFLPFLFASTGSRAIAELYERMVRHRRRSPQPLPASLRLGR